MNVEQISELIDTAVARKTMLPRAAYVSADWLEAERRPVHDRTWAYVGHASELVPGGFRRVRVGTDDMIVTRDLDGALHALHNVCRHRGAEVVVEECGTARRLVCPYHRWSYDLAGQLKVAHGMPKNMTLADFPLKSKTVREWHGLVFVVPDDNGLDGSGFVPLARKPAEFARLRLDEAKVVHTEMYDVAANWKVVRENFLECYHCSNNHPEFLAAFDLRALYDENGETGVFRIKEGMCSLSLDGQPVCQRTFGDYVDVPPSEWTFLDADAHPSFAVSATPDYAVVFSTTPISVDRSLYRCDWLVHRDAVEGVDYDIKNVVVVWHQTNLQDVALCESAQRGLSSSAFEPGPVSALREPTVVKFHHEYAGWMRENVAPPSGAHKSAG